VLKVMAQMGDQVRQPLGTLDVPTGGSHFLRMPEQRFRADEKLS
jgi:hypothetical protein